MVKSGMDEMVAASSRICERLTAFLDTLSGENAEVVLVAMIERTATVAACCAVVEDATAAKLRNALAAQINTLIKTEVARVERLERHLKGGA